MTTAKIADNGRLMCPECIGAELEYRQHVTQIHSYETRFDKDADELFVIGTEQQGTISVNDEYLYCPMCHMRYSVPWSDDDMFNDTSHVDHEGDVLKKGKLNAPHHQCPKCNSAERVDLVEEYEVSCTVLSGGETEEKHPFVVVDEYEDINYDSGGKNQHFFCGNCAIKWSTPTGLQSKLKDE